MTLICIIGAFLATFNVHGPTGSLLIDLVLWFLALNSLCIFLAVISYKARRREDTWRIKTKAIGDTFKIVGGFSFGLFFSHMIIDSSGKDINVMWFLFLLVAVVGWGSFLWGVVTYYRLFRLLFGEAEVNEWDD